jgi:DNA-directed RNA polymerase specialized sigma24 family protein
MPLTDDEWRELLPQIERIISAVGLRKNASPTVRDRLEEEAVPHLLKVIDQFNPKVASFSSWCKTVLGNFCVTLIRKEATARKRFGLYRDEFLHTHATEMRGQGWRAPPDEDEHDDAAAPPPRIDLVPVLEARLAAIDRLLVATYFGVLDFCGPAVVDRWCRDATCDKADELRRVAALPKRERQRATAEALGRKHDWVRTRIYRAMQQIGDVEFGES